MHAKGSLPAFLRRVFFTLLMMSSMAAPAHALSVISRSFDELVTLADLVVVGTVSARSSAYDMPARQHISTYVTLDNLQVVKGTLSAAQYTLRFAGGRVDGIIEVYPGVPELRVGERYVLFVRGNFRNFFPIVGIGQGIYRVMTDASGREVVMQSEDGGETAAHLIPHEAESLRSFVERVRAKSRGMAQ